MLGIPQMSAPRGQLTSLHGGPTPSQAARKRALQEDAARTLRLQMQEKKARVDEDKRRMDEEEERMDARMARER